MTVFALAFIYAYNLVCARLTDLDLFQPALCVAQNIVETVVPFVMQGCSDSV